jgi:hypothetical protein
MGNIEEAGLSPERHNVQNVAIQLIGATKGTRDDSAARIVGDHHTS